MSVPGSLLSFIRSKIQKILFWYREYRAFKHLIFATETCAYSFFKICKAMSEAEYQFRSLAKALKEAKEVS